MAVVDDYYNHPHVAAQIFPSYESAIRDSYRGLAGLGGLGLTEEEVRLQIDRRIAEIKTAATPLLIASVLFSIGGLAMGLAALLRGK